MTVGSSGVASLSRWEVVALVGTCLVATVLRIWNLGALGLQVDEGVMGLAVQGWLRDGLPILPSGAIYQRSIPFTGLQALTASVLGLDEFALRLPAAVFGVGAVLVTFALADALFGRRVAWISAVFIAVSAWEIELSRYGRFYPTYQVTYGLALLCFYRALNGGGIAWRWGFVLAALVTVTIHELAIVLVTCFAIPLFDRSSSPKTRVVALACSVPFVLGWYAYRRGFGRWFASLAPPHGLEQVSAVTPESVISIPGVPSLHIAPNVLIDVSATPDRVAFFIALLVGALGIIAVRRRVRPDWRFALVVLTMAFATAHLFMLAIITLFAWVLVSATSVRALADHRLWPFWGSLAVVLALWTAVLYGKVDGDLKGLALALFGFPNLLQHFVYWFALGWPLFLVASVASGLLMLDRFLTHGDRSLVFVLLATLAPMTLASAFDTYFESRYVFHIYPLLVMIFAWGMAQLWERVRDLVPSNPAPRRLVAGTALATCFWVTGDVGAPSWRPIQRSYDSARDPMRAIISWKAYAGFHQDQEGPARFVREQAGPDDLVGAIGVPHQLAVYRYYVGRLDVALSRPQNFEYQRYRGEQIIDWVTGARLVFDPQDLVAPDGRATWLLGDDVLLRDDLDYFLPEVERSGRALVKDPARVGRDAVSYAKRIF